MRLLLWLVTLAALAVGLALAARYNTGYVLVIVPPWRLELSLNLLIALIVLGFVVAYFALRTVAYTLRLPQTVKSYRAGRRRAAAAQALENSMRFSFEGRYGQALKSAASAFAAAHAQGLSALIAARAGHALRDGDLEAQWLARAALHDDEVRLARLMTEAELHLEARRYDEAQAALEQLAASGQRHIAQLRLALRLAQARGDWQQALRLARQLEKSRALTPEQAQPLKLRAHQEHLRSLSEAKALGLYWQEIPAGERASPRLVAEAARLLAAAGDAALARRIIDDALAAEWDSELALLYGELPDADVLGRIAQAEVWLKAQPRDARLLLSLGRLCRRQQLWGKAQSYLEASLSLSPSRAAHIELAQLADELGREQDAERHYRAAAAL